jgi:hypothetical protein
LVSGLLLLLYAVGGVILLAVLNGLLLTLALRLFLDREQILAARLWLVPLAFLLAIAELILYEWRRARVADETRPIRYAVEEALSQIPISTQPSIVLASAMQLVLASAMEPSERLRVSLLMLLRLLRESPDLNSEPHLTSTIQGVLRSLDQMPDSEKDRFRQLRTLLEEYQRRQAASLKSS